MYTSKKLDKNMYEITISVSKDEFEKQLSSGKIISVKLPVTIEFWENELKGVSSADDGKEAFVCCVSANERF